jgi:hypothetical protein
MGLLEIDGSGENPFPASTPKGQEAFRYMLHALTKRLTEIIGKHQFPASAPSFVDDKCAPIVYGKDEVVQYQDRVSAFVNEAHDAACEELLKCVPEWITLEEFAFRVQARVGDYLLKEIAAPFFPLARASVGAKTPGEEESGGTLLDYIQAQKAALKQVSSQLQAVRKTDYFGLAMERTKEFRIQKAFGERETTPRMPEGRREAQKPTPSRKRDDERFPKRAVWFRSALQERGITAHGLNWSHPDCPDRKTLKKTIEGQPVTEDVLGRLAKVLKVPFEQIPRD